MLGKAYHNWYDWKLNIEPDLEKTEHWYKEALKLGLKVSLKRAQFIILVSVNEQVEYLLRVD